MTLFLRILRFGLALVISDLIFWLIIGSRDNTNPPDSQNSELGTIKRV